MNVGAEIKTRFNSLVKINVLRYRNNQVLSQNVDPEIFSNVHGSSFESSRPVLQARKKNSSVHSCVSLTTRLHRLTLP